MCEQRLSAEENSTLMLDALVDGLHARRSYIMQIVVQNMLHLGVSIDSLRWIHRADGSFDLHCDTLNAGYTITMQFDEHTVSFVATPYVRDP